MFISIYRVERLIENSLFQNSLFSNGVVGLTFYFHVLGTLCHAILVPNVTVRGLILGPEFCYPEVFHGLHQSLQKNVGIITKYMEWGLFLRS
jgi:hypothetical protein